MTALLRGGTWLWGPSFDPSVRDVRIQDGSLVEGVEGAEAVDVSGLFLLPGFIDAHVHIGFFEPADVLAGGVTTVRDLAWPEDRIFPLSEASRSSDFQGPEILCVGPMLTVEGGYPTRAAWAPPGTGEVVLDPEATVVRLASSGASAIKVALNAAVGPTLDLDMLTRIVRAAHDAGLRVTAHIDGLEELDKALEAGLDELAHMLMSNERIPDDTIAKMVKQDVTVVPTLSCRFDDDLDQAIENLERFLSAGGRVVYGTDLGNEGPRPGIDPREIEAMSRAGMSPLDIVRSATIDPAGYLGLDDRGSLEHGKRADVIGFARDPIADVSELSRPVFVMREGRIVKGP